MRSSPFSRFKSVVNAGFLLLLVCLFPSAALAQEPSAPAPLSPESNRTEISQAPVVYEKVHTLIRYGEDGRGFKETSARIRVQSFQGLQKAGRLSFTYNAANERVELRSLRVLKPDGSVVAVGPESMVDLTLPVVADAPMYSDARQKNVEVPALTVGGVVEYDVVIHVFEPLTPDQFWDEWNLITDAVCLEEELVLDLPASRPVRVKNPEGVLPAVTESGGRRVYTWRTDNPKARDPFDFLRNFRSFDPGTILRGFSLAQPRQMLFSTFQSWSEIGQWYGSLAGDAQAISPEVRAAAQEITRNAKTPLEKVRAVYDFVSHIRYVSLSFGTGRYQPHGAGEVLANRYGDCKDKAGLVDALLATQGISSATALVDTQGELDGGTPTPQQFDHAINVVSVQGRQVWLDSTSGLQPFEYLLPQIRGKRALVVRSPLKSDLEAAEPGSTVSGTYRFDLEMNIAQDGAQDAHLALEVRGGDWEVLLRQVLSRFSLEQYGKMFSDVQDSAEERPKATFTEFMNTDPYDTANPLRLEARYRRPPPGDAESRKPPAGARVEPLVSPNWLVPLFPRSMPADKDRKQSVILNGPEEFFFHLKLTHPPSWQPVTVHPVRLTQDFAQFSFEASSDATTITVDADLKILVKEIPAERSEEYASFKKSAFNALAPLSAAFLGAGKGAGSSVERPESPAKSLFEAGRREAQNRNYTTSAQLYEQAVAKDPKYVEAWDSLGYTYNVLRQYAKAEAALRKALELDPAARLAHINLGLALEGQKKYEEAISEFLKELEVNPKNSRAHADLGRVYVITKQFEKAVPELETASQATLNDAAVFFNLGRAYAGAQQPDKAVKALEHSVEIEPIPNRWNWVAYELAQDKLALEQAQQYSQSSISTMTEKMQQVSLDHVTSEDVRQVSALAAYWDTFGWIQFQKGNVAEAEKYVKCSWQVRWIGEIGDHLGQIYDKQGRKSEAIRAYELSLATTMPKPETKDRLLGLLGPDADIETLAHQANQQLADARTLAIANTAKAEGIAEFWVLLSPGAKVVGVKFISGDDQLAQFASELAAANYPNFFPDETAIQLLRRGRLSCSESSAQCRFLLESAEAVRATN